MQRARGALLPSTQTLSAKRGTGAEAECEPARSAGAEGEEGTRGEAACPQRSDPLSLGLVNQLRSMAALCVPVPVRAGAAKPRGCILSELLCILGAILSELHCILGSKACV